MPGIPGVAAAMVILCLNQDRSINHFQIYITGSPIYMHWEDQGIEGTDWPRGMIIKNWYQCSMFMYFAIDQWLPKFLRDSTLFHFPGSSFKLTTQVNSPVPNLVQSSICYYFFEKIFNFFALFRCDFIEFGLVLNQNTFEIYNFERRRIFFHFTETMFLSFFDELFKKSSKFLIFSFHLEKKTQNPQTMKIFGFPPKN